MGGTCKAPLLATAADSELLNCSNCCVGGLLMQSPHPACPSLACFPSGCEMGKMECQSPCGGEEGESAVGLPCSSLQLVHSYLSVRPDSCALPTCLPCTAGNIISFLGKSIPGWPSSLSMGHQKVGFEHKMDFI